MKKSLNKKFALIFALILVAVFLVLLVGVQIISMYLTNTYIETDVFATHARMDDRLGVVLNGINNDYTMMTECEQLRGMESDDIAERERTFAEVIEAAALSGDYKNIVLVSGEDVYSLNEGYDSPAESFIQMVEAGNRILYLGMTNSDKRYIEIGRRFQSESISGVVVFYLSDEVLTDICRETDEKLGFSQLITSEYLILSKSIGNDMGKTILEQDNYPLSSGNYSQKIINGVAKTVVITECSSDYDTGLYFVSVLDNGELTRGFTILGWVLFAVAMLALIVAILLAWRLSKKITSPINKLSNEISAVDFSTRYGIVKFAEKGDELYALWENYDLMLKRLYKLMDENIENVEIQRRLELDALQSQINPHFLYNTLDAIAWMAKIKKQPEIEVLVINLAKFFRLSLHKGDKYVTIGDEVEIVEHFLEIEKIRFPDTLTYSCHIPDELREYRIPKLLLQPIAENCIKHGFADRNGIGHINICAESVGDDIILSVEDNGVGFAVPEDILSGEVKSGHNGYGLKNVNKRIMLEYGEGYGMTIYSEVGKGTKVSVKVQKTCKI